MGIDALINLQCDIVDRLDVILSQPCHPDAEQLMIALDHAEGVLEGLQAMRNMRDELAAK